ncbi:MAG: zinc ABC transporter substrate-binding protein [Desulfocapsaceae bacterium]|nr:zinc ABC transporter substrate-binding protein [Desulfocapsaceae bacterium]
MHKKIVMASIVLSFLWFTTMVLAAPPLPLKVFVSVPPQKWVSDNIGGALVTTEVLVDKGQDPHTYEPTPKQLTTLSQAKLYFTLDLEFEKQIIPKLGQTVPTLSIVDTADSIPKIAMSEHEHDEPKSSNEAHSNKEHQHQEGLDPHVWLSPLNLKIMAADMARAMIASDPANKVTYEKNLLETTRILDQVHQKIEQKLAPYQGASFYVFHPAFGYFAHTYHLQQQAIETGGKSPTPRQLSSLITQAKASKARVIFVQPQFDPRSAQAIANAIHGEVVPLDPLAEDVAANLETMASKIQAAFIAR